MKFLVLAICVYAASAAVVPKFVGKPWQQSVGIASAVAEVSRPVAVEAVVPVAKYATSPVKPVSIVDSDVQAVVLRSDTDVKPDGYNYAFETSNGIAASSSGALKKVDNIDVLNVQGQFQYVSPEGVPVLVSYVADENGYQPKSDLLPVAPPVPEAILRSLEYIAAHPRREEIVKKL